MSCFLFHLLLLMKAEISANQTTQWLWEHRVSWGLIERPQCFGCQFDGRGRGRGQEKNRQHKEPWVKNSLKAEVNRGNSVSQSFLCRYRLCCSIWWRQTSCIVWFSCSAGMEVAGCCLEADNVFWSEGIQVFQSCDLRSPLLPSCCTRCGVSDPNLQSAIGKPERRTKGEGMLRQGSDVGKLACQLVTVR